MEKNHNRPFLLNDREINKLWINKNYIYRCMMRNFHSLLLRALVFVIIYFTILFPVSATHIKFDLGKDALDIWVEANKIYNKNLVQNKKDLDSRQDPCHPLSPYIVFCRNS